MLVGLFTGAACTRPSDQSLVTITNGKETSAYPAVVKIDIQVGDRVVFCSGTFLSDAVLLTAAHCFRTPAGDEVRLGQTKALSYRRHPGFQYHLPAIPGFDGTAYDVALVRFPRGTSQHFLSLTNKPADPGAEVILVGYGSHNASHSEPIPIKRKGRTIILDHLNDRYRIEGSDGMTRQAESNHPLPNEKYSSIAGGDSGGPMLTADGGLILGIASWGKQSSDRQGIAEGTYHDVLGQESQAFLKDALK